MKVSANENRAAVGLVAGGEEQAAIAVDLLAKADVVAVSLQALSEFAWILAGLRRSSS